MLEKIRIPVLAVSLMLAGSSLPVFAGDWKITPRFLLNQTFSDNVDLASTNTRSDFTTEVTPGLSLRGEGGRLSVTLDYNLQALRYKNADELNSENHQLQADITSELYKQIVFLDVSSRISQQLQDNQGVISSSNITSSGNRSDVMTYTVSPYIRHHFGAYADMEARLQRNEVFNDADSSSVANSTRDEYRVNINSGRSFSKLPWSLTYSDREVSSESSGKSTFKTINSQIRYAISRNYSLTATVGYDDNDFASRESTNTGISWTMGLIWTPSSRTSLEARMGDRFFGRTIFVSGQHRRKHSVFNVSYNEELQTLNDIQSQANLLPSTDAFGQAVFDPDLSSNIPLATNSSTLLRDETSISRQFSFGYTYKKRRNTLNLSVSNRQQEFQLGGDEETSRSLDLSVSRTLSRSTSGGVNLGWSTNEFANDQESSFYETGLFVRHTINRYLNGSLSYNFIRRTSDNALSEYEENNVSAFLTAHF